MVLLAQGKWYEALWKRTTFFSHVLPIQRWCRHVLCMFIICSLLRSRIRCFSKNYCLRLRGLALGKTETRAISLRLLNGPIKHVHYLFFVATSYSLVSFKAFPNAIRRFRLAQTQIDRFIVAFVGSLCRQCIHSAFSRLFLSTGREDKGYSQIISYTKVWIRRRLTIPFGRLISLSLWLSIVLVRFPSLSITSCTYLTYLLPQVHYSLLFPYHHFHGTY